MFREQSIQAIFLKLLTLLPAGTYQAVHGVVELVDRTRAGVWAAGAAAFATAMVGLWQEPFTVAGKLGRSAVIGGGLMAIKAIASNVGR